MSTYSNGKNSSSQERQKTIVPKPEMLDFDFPEDALYSRHGHVGDNVASSSGSTIRSFFIGMGFLPSLVDKVIEEKGDEDADLLLETLMGYSDVQMDKSMPSNYLDGLFIDKNEGRYPKVSSYIQPKEEPDVFAEDLVDKKASLLMMNFSVNEVDFALEKLGEDAPINELVDFIAAAQIAEELEKESDDSSSSEEEQDQTITNETLFGTMEKTLCLLEMGFSENEVSIAIEKFGSEIPIAELADSIFTGQIPSKYTDRKKLTSTLGRGLIHNSFDTVKSESDNCNTTAVPQSRNINQGESSKGKRPKEENFDDIPASLPQLKESTCEKKHKGKRPKQDYVDETSSLLDPAWLEEKVDPNITSFEMFEAFKSNSCKSVNEMVGKPPYFFYGNVVNLSYDCWAKVSQFLYGIEPEFVQTQFFSALSRKEGYVHNLPAGNRFRILPKFPLTVQNVIPHTKKWWPCWDTRTQLSCMGSEVGVSSVCNRLGNILAESRGVLSSDQQKDILRNCQMLNLVWVGPNKLGLPEPEHWERILGYPLNHTQVLENNLTQRRQLLKQSFQTDTLGYHLSVLKSIFPGGLTMLSVFSGIGGAVVTLHRLGIHMKGVVSVETSEANRRILRNWWHGTGQNGELVLIEDIQSLTSKKLESLIDKLGGFDFVICQNTGNYARGSSMTGTDDDKLPDFDFTSFHEFVRVLQRVRNIMERRN